MRKGLRFLLLAMPAALALRYSSLDLTGSPISGGRLSDITLALNWYLNNNTRIMFNIVNADVDGAGSANFFMTRFGLDF